MIRSRGKAIRSVKNARQPFLSGVPWGKDSTDPQNSETQQAINSAIISEGLCPTYTIRLYSAEVATKSVDRVDGAFSKISASGGHI